MTTAKGGRPATGAVKWTKDKAGLERWHGRVTMPDGKRQFVPLDPAIPRTDEARARACAVQTAEFFRNAGVVKKDVKETVAEYAGRWLDDREGRVNSIRDDRSRIRDHVLPVLGPLDVRTFTRDDVERLRDALDAKIGSDDLAWKTAANVWTLVTTMADDMVNSKRRELRIRSDNPCKDVRAPDRGANKAKQFLYPTEFLQFVSCEAVPLRWRRAVALAVYLFVRDGELRVLRWEAGDVDLDHGVLSITRAHDRRALTGADRRRQRRAARLVGSPSKRTCCPCSRRCTTRRTARAW